MDNFFQKRVFGATAMALLPVMAFGAGRRPNIVFAFGDDYGRYASAYSGDGGLSNFVDTPNFDRIAGEGVLMTNAFTPAPSSTPCRSALCSGEYFWRTGLGAFLAGARWDDSLPAFPLMLEESGYHVGYTYKVWGPGKPVNRPIGEERNRYEAHGNSWATYSIQITDAGRSKEELLAEIRGNFEDFLDAGGAGTPFFYWWGPTNTHRPWAKGSGKELWGIEPDSLKGHVPPYLPDIPEIREDLADYLGECQAFDAGLGILLAVLEERGELDNTLIVVSGDHGIPGFPRGKCNLYELGAKVGMAVRYPRKIRGGRILDDFASLMDLAPTFLEYGGVDVPEVMDGRSLKKVWESRREGIVDKTRDYVVVGRERHGALARAGKMPYPQRALITSRYKYIRNFKPERDPIGTYGHKFWDIDGGPTKDWYMGHYFDREYSWYMDIAFGKRPYEELYDLQSDPDELHNLASDPGYGDILKSLSDRLDSILTAGKDPRMEEGTCIFETPAYLDAR